MTELDQLAEGVTVAVVDDDDSMRGAITTLIDSLGGRADGYAAAEELLMSNRLGSYDCLILDVRMPGMGGLELQSRLAADCCRLPIVFITAHYSECERAKALAAGAVAFLRKPFSERELLDAIDVALRPNQ